MVRKTKEASHATRERLLDAAEGLFRERGVTRTSLTDIAAGAGMTRGAVYWHFKDKADLFRAMCERATLPLEASFERADADAPDDPFATLRSRSIAALRHLADDPQVQCVFEIVFHKSELVDELAGLASARRDDHDACLVEIAAVIRRAAAAGQLPADIDAPLAARGLHAAIVGIMHEWVLDPTAYDLSAMAPALIDMFLAGMRAQPPRVAAGDTRTRDAVACGRESAGGPRAAKTA